MEDRGPQVRAVAITFLILPGVATLMRCWVRIKMIKSFALDDWLSVFTLFWLIIYGSLIIAGVEWGVGQHVSHLSTHQKVVAMKIWYAGEITYIICATTLRFAVAAFLLRIAIRKNHRLVIYGLSALNLLFNSFYLLFTIFQCQPIEGFWTRAAGVDAKCRSDIAVNATLASSATSAFIDWGFGIMPVFILWELNVTTKKKLGLAVIMGLGVFASAGPLVRIPYTVALESTHDFLYDTIDVAIWSFVEPGLGLTVISVLTLRPLFILWFHKACSTLRSSDALSIGEMPPPRKPTQYDWEGDENHQRTVSVHGGGSGGFHPGEDGRWTPDRPRRKMGRAVRMTCEIKSVTDIDVVEVRSPRRTPPGGMPVKGADYV